MMNPPNDNHNNANHFQQQFSRRLTKCILIGVLAGFCLFLQMTVWTLELLLEEKQEWYRAQRAQDYEAEPKTTASTTSINNNDNNNAHDAAATYRSATSDTYKPIALTEQRHDLHRHKQQSANGQDWAVASQAFYQQAAELWLSSWDPNVEYDNHDDDALMMVLSLTEHAASLAASSASESSSLNNNPHSSLSPTINATLAWHALEKAAELGHATAQFHVANAYASGIFLGEQVQDTWQYQSSSSSSDAATHSDKDHGNDNDNKNSNNKERQKRDNIINARQQQRAWLYWHMAAVGGNVEAALAMASRLEERRRNSNNADANDKDASSNDGSSSSSTSPTTTCSELLPYYQEAALGILDALETDPQSRAKVAPATDKHILYQIHLHGGTPSKLDYHNKADESPEALQFYHLRATSSRTDPQVAAAAGYTLGNYYHHGVRGVAQNVTLALEYYERAALLNHWEAAGEAGTFYLWGIGVKQDAYLAHKMFRLGMPLGMSGCQRRYQQKLAKNRNNNNAGSSDDDDNNLSLCDTSSLNGMGILKLVGLPHVMKSDPVQAEELFLMARDQGSGDAAYNHAMMKLGYGQHWKPLTQLDDQGQFKVVDEKFPTSGASANLHSPTLSEYQAILTDLTMAAGKGHLQARLRLGMLFAKGVTVGSSKTTAITKDCSKALKQFKWIAENACPFKTKRLRKAYKQYIAGDTQASLLNYLTAAETGSTIGLVNAAFLLEQGECLSTSVPAKKTGHQMSSSSSSVSSASSSSAAGTTTAPTMTSLSTSLSSVDCAKASARLWKAAASRGHGEASLRVGDFYYYQRFREPEESKAGVAGVVGPFGWARYLLYPEESLPILYEKVVKGLQWLEQEFVSANTTTDDTSEPTPSSRSSMGKSARTNDGQSQNDEQVCKADGEPGECSASQGMESEDESKATSSSSGSSMSREEELQHFLESDLEMAAHYYRMAAENTDNARAHFNLGFLYEWGLGLKQDFPLAKRHYDLAASGSSKEAEIPVAIALWAMSVHEKCLKFYRSWYAYSMDLLYSEAMMQVIPEPQMNVILSHIASWESVALLALLVLLVYLLRVREQQQQYR